MQAFPSNPTSSLQPPHICRFLYLSPHGCESGRERRWVPHEPGQPWLAAGPICRQHRGRRTSAEDSSENGLRWLKSWPAQERGKKWGLFHPRNPCVRWAQRGEQSAKIRLGKHS